MPWLRWSKQHEESFSRTEDVVDPDLHDYSARILARHLVSHGVSLHRVRHGIRVTNDRCSTLEAEPSATVDLAHCRTPFALDVGYFLRPIGCDDPHDGLLGVERERDRNNVERTIGAVRRERAKVAFGEKLDLVGAEFCCSASHGSRR